MKVKLNAEYKKYYTLEDLERAKAVIKAEKEDGAPINEYAEMAVREALKNTGDYFQELLKAEAETAKNSRIWNMYTDDSGYMDVWIRATAKTYDGFIEIGAYLSDIWNTGAEAYKVHMYIQYYKKQQSDI